jgi:hypothetical protein
MTGVNPDGSNDVYANDLRIIYFVLSICGLIFSSTILIILSKKLKKTKHSDTILTIVTLSIDCVASFGLLFRAIFTQYPYNILQVHFNWCVFDYFLNTHSLSFSGIALSILSAQRMLVILFNRRLSNWIWISMLLIIISIPWGMAIYHIVYSNVQLSAIKVFCIGKTIDKGNPIYLILIIYTVVSYLITIISYISIIIFSCKQCLNHLNLNIDKQTVYRECRGIIFRSLLFLFSYMLTYSGRMYTWVYEYSTGKPRTWTMEYVSIILLSTSVVVNCLTVLYMNKEVNNEFIKFLVKLKSTLYRQ